MDSKTLSGTGLKITPIGLGLAALGRPGYINLGHADDLAQNYDVGSMEGHAHEVLDAAWSTGVRYFDAARSYGRAESFLASWLKSRRIKPQDLTVGSKWGYTYTADWKVNAEVHEVKEHTLPVLNRQYKESRSLLGDHLNIYQIHSATIDSGVLEDPEVIDSLAALRDQGTVIGLTLSGPQQTETLRKAMTLTIDGSPLFGAVQATWNLLERSIGFSLLEASQAGFGIIIKEALANGRLTDRNTDPSFKEEHQLMEMIAREKGTTIDALALAAALAQPWADVVLSGAATVQQLLSNVRALEVDWDDALASELSPLVETPDFYWQNRSRLAWN